jgi:ribosome biogenesis GTPase / thiamine phosphate phosphatase
MSLLGAIRDINNIMEKLGSLGYITWFNNRVDAEMIAAHDVARVVSVHKDSYVITKGFGGGICRVIGTSILYSKVCFRSSNNW